MKKKIYRFSKLTVAKWRRLRFVPINETAQLEDKKRQLLKLVTLAFVVKPVLVKPVTL